METFQILKPGCFNRFYCKGKECRISCCCGWKIQMEEGERKKIEEVLGESPELFSLLAEEMQVAGALYEFVLDSEGRCPMLSDEKLCSLHQKYGPGILPYTCQVFPRMYHKYLNQMEQGLSLGCEKTLELLFEEKDGLQFRSQAEPLEHYWKLDSVVNQNTISDYPVLPYYYDIQSLCLGMLQGKDVILEDRMIYLGMALFHVDTLAKTGKESGIVPYISQFINQMEQVTGVQQPNELGTVEIAALYSNLELLQLFMDSTDDSYSRVVKKIGSKLDLTYIRSSQQEGNFELSIEKYQACRIQFDKFVKNKEYFFENMAVAFLLSKNIPFFHLEDGIWKNYMYFVWILTIIKLALAVSLDEDAGIPEMMDCCVTIFRKLGHSPVVYNAVVESFEKNKSDTVAHMAILLKS